MMRSWQRSVGGRCAHVWAMAARPCAQDQAIQSWNCCAASCPGHILRDPQALPSVHEFRQPASKVMPRPAPESDMREPRQPRTHEWKSSRRLLATASGHRSTAIRPPAHDADGRLRNPEWMHTYLNQLHHWALQTIRKHLRGRTIGPRPNACTKLADNLHKTGVQDHITRSGMSRGSLRLTRAN